jgi:transcriptional activator of cad operon
MSLLRIGDVTLDTADGTLRSATGVARLEPKVQAVLQLLVDRAGTVVSQDTLLSEVWPETHVAPGALARTVSVLRQALRDEVRAPRYIETVPKRGYRLIAAVESVSAVSTLPVAAVHRDPMPVRDHRRVALLAAAIVVALASSTHENARPLRGPMHHWSFRHDTRLGNEDAYEHYSRAIARDPGSLEAHAGLATVYVFRANYMPDRQQWVDAAMNAARRAEAIDPASLTATRVLGMAYAQAGRLDDAARYYRKVLDIQPADGSTSSNLGLVLMAAGRVADALSLFERHVTLEPHSAAGYALLARGLSVVGYSNEGAAAATAALAIEPNNRDAHMVLVRADLTNRDYAAAEARLRRILQAHPDCAQCSVQLGVIDQLRDQPEQAAAKYRAASMMMPEFAPASLRLAQVLAMTGDAFEAGRLLDEIDRAALATIERGAATSGHWWQLAATASIRGDRRLAMERYWQAVAAGRRDAAWDRWDPLLSAIQTEPAFARVHYRTDLEHQAAAPIAGRLRSTLGDIERHRRH